MNSIANKEDYENILQRINKLTAGAKPLWGIMTVNEMVCHITDPVRDVLGMRNEKSEIPVFLRPVVRFLLVSKIPFPKNLFTLKSLKQSEKGGGTKPTGFENDKKALLEVLASFYETTDSFKFSPHLAIGRVSREKNGQMAWKHINHHLRQFGC